MSGRDKISSRRNLFKKYPELKIWLPVLILTFIFMGVLGDSFRDAGHTETEILVPVGSGVKVPDRPSFVGKKVVALTFDDGPSSVTTPRLLDILKNNDVCATFFTLGSAAERNPEIIQREKSECHEVGTHTISHAQLNKLSAAGVREEIGGSEGILKGITGENPRVLRPPYGAVNGTVQNVSNLPLILWSVDTLDWKYKETESIMGYTLEQVYDGGIILMHDIHETSVDAVETLVKTLRSEGYEFATIDELAALKGVDLVAGEIYYRF